MDKSPITTHILDLHKGQPGSGVYVELYAPSSGTQPITSEQTDLDGRILNWPEDISLEEGTWKLSFKTKAWFEIQNRKSFFSDITLAFHVDASESHYHVPLLLNEFGYSTYRGS